MDLWTPLARNRKLIGFVALLLAFALLYAKFWYLLRIPEPDLAWISDPANALELRWRMLWGLSSIALILVTVINGAVAAAIITRNPFGPAGYVPMFAAVAGLVAWVIYQSGSQDFGGGASDAVLRQYSAARDIPVNAVVEAMVPLSGAVAVLVIMAAICLLLVRGAMDADTLVVRHRDFRHLLGSSTAMLVIGVIQTYFLFRMATTAVETSDTAGVIAGTLTFGGSTAYTVLLLLIFGPIAYALNRWSWDAAHRVTGSRDVQTLREWLERLGIYNSPTRVLSQALLASAPAVVGVVLNLVPKVV